MDPNAICSYVWYAEERGVADILITTENNVSRDINTQNLKW